MEKEEEKKGRRKKIEGRKWNEGDKERRAVSSFELSCCRRFMTQLGTLISARKE